ncbi:MAG: transcription initiation factor IIB [Candidatus Bathyarchaeia archaeon]
MQVILFDKCPECGSTNLISDPDTGEVICGNCGLVVQESIMDKGPEWRAFTQEEKKSRSRVGVPISFSVHDKGLSTSIDKIDRDALGRKLPQNARLQMWRLKKWQIRSRVHSSIDRNLAQAMTEIDRLSDKLSIPSAVKEKAAVIYRKALEQGLVRGRSIAAIAAAALYAACRLSGTPRNLKEISEASLVGRKDIARCYRLLLRELNLAMPVTDPSIYIPKIAEKANMPGHVQTLALKVLNETKRKRISAGKDPVGLAAAALYIAANLAGERRTQKEIADAAGVTEVTVRNRYKTLKKQLSLEIPD